MVKNLGCNLDALSSDFKTYFKHPASDNDVCVFLDLCHMMKLVCNTLGDKKSIVDGDDIFIKWEFIDSLHKLQVQEGLHFANRLRDRHIAWHKNKMNVRLAAQLLSESVATSLEFCSQEKISGFVECEATVKFIRIFNKLFDMLNSGNLSGKAHKSPMHDRNIVEMRSSLIETKQYIIALKESRNRQYIFNSNRKTGFVGFCVCIDSVLKVYDFLTTNVQLGMKFFCTFKFSQDHLELFLVKLDVLAGVTTTHQLGLSNFIELFFESSFEDLEK